MLSFGYEEEEVLGKNVWMLMPEFISANHDSYLLNAMEKEELTYFKRERESLALNKNGFIFPVYLNIK